MGWFEQNAPQAQTPADPAQQSQAVAPQGGGDYKSIFNQLFPGDTLSPEQLAASESKLPPGWRLLGPNAAGQRSKIELPNGQIIDAIGGAGSGQNRKQFMVTGGGGATGAGGNLGNFQIGSFTGGGQYPLSSVMGEGLAAPWTTPFNAPDPNSVTNDQALQWQMKRGMDAIQRSAASKGTLLTGGLLTKLQMQGQDIGSQYYNDVYSKSLDRYKMAHDIFEGNQSNLYDRLFNVAGMGQKAAANLSSDAGTYGSNAGNTMLGQGNAAAAGSVNQGNIWGNAVGGIGQNVADIYQQQHQSAYKPGYGVI